MAYGVEEFNPETAWARFTSGFKNDQSSDYNKPPELRFVDGLGTNAVKLQGSGTPTTPRTEPGAPYFARKNK